MPLSLTHFFEPFKTRKRDEFLNLFATEGTLSPTIDDPVLGKMVGIEGLNQFFDAFEQWLSPYSTGIEIIATIQDSDDSCHRVVVESLIPLSIKGTLKKLPVAMVGEHHPITKKLVRVRIYHTTWLLFQSHRIRPPLLAKNPALRLPIAVQRYQDALTKGDLAAILASFDVEKAYVQQPSGEDYVCQGLAGLTQFYNFLFSFGGGAHLDHCCVTENCENCAIEYNIIRLGDFTVPHQAGIAIYQQNDEGQLIAARIYDDFEPPSQS